MKNSFQVLEKGLCVELQQRYIYHLEKKNKTKKDYHSRQYDPSPASFEYARSSSLGGFLVGNLFFS